MALEGGCETIIGERGEECEEGKGVEYCNESPKEKKDNYIPRTKIRSKSCLASTKKSTKASTKLTRC